MKPLADITYTWLVIFELLLYSAPVMAGNDAENSSSEALLFDTHKHLADFAGQ